MEIRPEFCQMKVSSTATPSVTQAVVEAKLLSNVGEQIARILSITADATVSAIEVFTGEARFTGKVHFRVLFVGEDGKNRCLETTTEFSDKIENNALKVGAFANIDVCVLDTEVVALTSTEVKLASVVEVTLLTTKSEEFNCLVAGGEGIFVRNEELSYLELISTYNATFNVSNTLEKPSITEICLSEHRVVLTEAVADRDMIRLIGVIVSDVCGETEDGLIASYRVETPFNEEISAVDVRSGDIVTANISITGDARMEANEQNRAIVFLYELNVNCTAYKTENITVATDVFSPAYELLCSFESVNLCKKKVCSTINDRVEGSVTLSNDMPIVDNILATTALRLNVTNVRAEDGEATVEGMASGNVIYYSAESDQKSSVAVELPFSLKVEINDVEKGDTLTANGEITAVTLKIRRGNEIDLKADVSIQICATKMQTDSVITSVELGDKKEIPTNAITVHIAKRGETLWSIAKILAVTPEIILAQNPLLSFPLEGGERVMLYRHLLHD